MNRHKPIPITPFIVAVMLAGQGQPQTARAEVGQRLTKISLDELPEPPAEIRKLLESAKVSFQTGDRDDSPGERLSGSSGRAGGENGPDRRRRLAAETKYKIDYSFNNRCRWRTRETGGMREVVITVRYLDVSFGDSHTVWFRKRPESDRFWEDRLVLHELDHVKISSDPDLAKRFAQMLRENAVFSRPVEAGAVVNEALVLRLIEQQVEDLFEQVSQLIAIRYRELDRVTDHGIRPLPADSRLNELLRPAAAGDRRPE